MKTLNLNGQWLLRQAGTERFIEAVVPGSVLADLQRAGLMDDPYYRDREEHAANLYCQDDYEYTREFFLDDDWLAFSQVLLFCEGLDTLSEVRINGHLIAATDNMHRRYEFTVSKYLHNGRNEISVLFHSPLPVMEQKQQDDPLWGAGDAIPGYSHIRKGHYMFGWDWGPQIPDVGIWKAIYLQGVENARLTDFLILQNHEQDNVSLILETTVEADDAFFSQKPIMVATVTGPDGYYQQQDFAVSESRATFTINMQHPQLWWPAGYGAQPLYVVSVELSLKGLVIDEEKKRIGLRTLVLRREPDEWGESFAFVINGVPIYIRGANYIPEDNITGHLREQRTRALLQDAIAANMNCLRVWGGGKYPEDYFFDACDELGLIIWQDFMFACSQYRLTKEFAKTVYHEAVDTVKRIRHHACLGLWCGNNEMEVAWVEWGIPQSDDLRADYLRLYETILPGVVSTYDPQRSYWPSSPSSGGHFDNPNDENRGDVHYWDVWHGLKPFTEYRKFIFRFCSEFGFQSFPGDKTVASFTLPEDRNIFSYVMERHQKNGTANQKILYYLSENYKYPQSFSTVLYASQILQAEAIRYGVEHWRRHRGRNMGVIYWQLNDCWPVASWSSIDSKGRWKALHYAAKKFYQPILLSVEESGTIATFCLTNDTREAVTATVVWQLRDTVSSVLAEGRYVQTVDALQAVFLPELDFSNNLQDPLQKRRAYLAYSLYVKGQMVSAGTTLFVPAKHFAFADPKMAVFITENEREFVLQVQSQAYARYVELDLVKDDCIFNDNYFDISAGQPVTITVQKSTLSTSLTVHEVQEQLRVRSVFDLDEATAVL